MSAPAPEDLLAKYHRAVAAGDMHLMGVEATPAIRMRGRVCFHGLIYASHTIASLVARLKTIAATDEVVLITGETGTGKELIARAVHRESKRHALPFVPFNCSPLSCELIESRLFGFARAPSPARFTTTRGRSGRRRAARYSWTRSAI